VRCNRTGLLFSPALRLINFYGYEGSVNRPTREWYLKAAIENGWSQNVLVRHISA